MAKKKKNSSPAISWALLFPHHVLLHSRIYKLSHETFQINHYVPIETQKSKNKAAGGARKRVLRRFWFWLKKNSQDPSLVQSHSLAQSDIQKKKDVFDRDLHYSRVLGSELHSTWARVLRGEKKVSLPSLSCFSHLRRCPAPEKALNLPSSSSFLSCSGTGLLMEGFAAFLLAEGAEDAAAVAALTGAGVEAGDAAV